MPADRCRATKRTGIRHASVGLATVWVVVAFTVAPLGAQVCPGDCSGDGFVTVDELLRCVNIALGGTAVDVCRSCDGNSSGAVTVDELIQGVGAALVGCPAALAARGSCRRPGPDGLMPCAPGTRVSVLRCDNPRTCLDDPAASTMLNTGTVGDDGSFSVDVSEQESGNAPLVIEAAVDEAAQTRYRIIDFGSIAAGGDGAGRGAVLDDLIIDPSSEAAVQLLGTAGLESFADTAIVEIIAEVRAANAETTFAGLDAADAAEVAMQTAANDPVVEETIQRSQMALIDVAGNGAVTASSVFNGNQFPAALAIDGTRTTSWFSDGATGGDTETFRWTGTQDDVITSVAVLSNAQHANPAFRGFGFGSVQIQVLAASGAVVFDSTRDLPGMLDPDVEVFPNVLGRSVLLTFSGHDDPSCGGFSELQVVARRTLGF